MVSLVQLSINGDVIIIPIMLVYFCGYVVSLVQMSANGDVMIIPLIMMRQTVPFSLFLFGWGDCGEILLCCLLSR